MSCTQLQFETMVFQGSTTPVESKRVTLTKPAAVHLVQQDACAAPLQLCIKRVVKCQKGCYYTEYLHDFPIDGCDPILPPGEYEFSVEESYIPLFGGLSVSLGVILEDVTSEYIQAIIANKSGGKC